MQLVGSESRSDSSKTFLTEADIKGMTAQEVQERLLRMQSRYLGAMGTLNLLHQAQQEDTEALSEAFESTLIQTIRVNKLIEALATVTSRENAERIYNEMTPGVIEAYQVALKTGYPDVEPANIVSSIKAPIQ